MNGSGNSLGNAFPGRVGVHSLIRKIFCRMERSDIEQPIPGGLQILGLPS